jgi:hypothetical protein
MALVGIVLFAFILRWAFSRGSSVVAAPPKPGSTDEYGLLVVASIPSTYIEGEIQRRTLEDAGLRANLANTLDGPRVMVWPADLEKAHALLKKN